MKDNEVGVIISNLRNIAAKHHDKECLRDLISKELRPLIAVVKEHEQLKREVSTNYTNCAEGQTMTEILYDDENGWEKGAVYEFSNDDVTWFQALVRRIDGISTHDYSYLTTKGNWFKHIRKCQAPLGKIHKKPVELIEGQWYKFTANETSEILCGLYDKSCDWFVVVRLPYASYSKVARLAASNIIRMVEAKDNEHI